MKGRNLVAVLIFCRRLLAPCIRRTEQLMSFHFVSIQLSNTSPRGNFEESNSASPGNTAIQLSILRKVRLMSTAGRKRSQGAKEPRNQQPGDGRQEVRGRESS